MHYMLCSKTPFPFLKIYTNILLISNRTEKYHHVKTAKKITGSLIKLPVIIIQTSFSIYQRIHCVLRSSFRIIGIQSCAGHPSVICSDSVVPQYSQ